jgi:hypothetical protein
MVKPITIRVSLKSVAYRLWDEQHKKLVGYRRMREIRRERAAALSRSAVSASALCVALEEVSVGGLEEG